MFIVSEAWIDSKGDLGSNAEVFNTKELVIDYIKETTLNMLDIDYSDWKEEDFEQGDYDTDNMAITWHFIEVKGKLVEE